MTAATACRTCGNEPRQGGRFCDGCGAPVTMQDTRAAYKQVTVLFVDVVHSMDIAAAVGPERLHQSPCKKGKDHHEQRPDHRSGQRRQPRTR
jgi:adenylate cyclase